MDLIEWRLVENQGKPTKHHYLGHLWCSPVTGCIIKGVGNKHWVSLPTRRFMGKSSVKKVASQIIGCRWQNCLLPTHFDRAGGDPSSVTPYLSF